MFVDNFDEMYDKMSEVRQRNIICSLNDYDNPFENDMFMDDFSIKAIIMIQDSINRLRELGVPDEVMTFTVAELAVLSKMSNFNIKIMWIENGTVFTT